MDEKLMVFLGCGRGLSVEGRIMKEVCSSEDGVFQDVLFESVGLSYPCCSKYLSGLVNDGFLVVDFVKGHKKLVVLSDDFKKRCGL
jgi:hypothetical protein